jgi:hypothetical protein
VSERANILGTSIWDAETIETRRLIEESGHSVERGLEIFSDALREQNQRIEADIALLLRAGISFSRMSIGNHQGEDKRSLLVDGRPVQHYTITYTVDGKPL